MCIIHSYVNAYYAYKLFSKRTKHADMVEHQINPHLRLIKAHLPPKGSINREATHITKRIGLRHRRWLRLAAKANWTKN